MGLVYLCQGKTAEVPYYFERARVHIWSIEELCYFVLEQAWLLEPEVLGKELAAWVGQQCELPELGRRLLEAGKSESPVMDFVKTLFAYTGYASEKEADQVEKILRLNESAGELERARARGDYFLESGKPVLALREYEELLRELKGMEPGFLGKLYHNHGVALAQLFLFDRAQVSFERAFGLTKSRESALQFLAAKRFSLKEQEYVDFLARHPEFYEASLVLEERMQDCEAGYRKSEEAAFLLQATQNKQQGAGSLCRRMLRERTEVLKEAYRSSVVS